MNKEELNQEIAKLKQYIDSHAEQVKDLEHDLKVATQNYLVRVACIIDEIHKHKE